jgi:hypothetical protein
MAMSTQTMISRRDVYNERGGPRRNRRGNRRHKQTTIAPKLPKTARATALYPSPRNKRVCAGKTERAVSSSGAPITVVPKVKIYEGTNFHKEKNR